MLQLIALDKIQICTRKRGEIGQQSPLVGGAILCLAPSSSDFGRKTFLLDVQSLLLELPESYD